MEDNELVELSDFSEEDLAIEDEESSGLVSSSAGKNSRDSLLSGVPKNAWLYGVAIAVGLALGSVSILCFPSRTPSVTLMRQPGLEDCLRSWTRDELRYKERWQRYRDLRPDTEPKFKLDYIEPLWDCEVKDRVGRSPFGDGPKFMCDAEFSLKDPDCLVYSIGSNGDRSFEEAVLAINPQCEVHTLDCTLNMSQPWLQRFVQEAPKVGFQFHDSCLGRAETSSNYKGVGNDKSVTLHEAMDYASRPRPITHFKIDCEGCEYTSFFNELADFDDSNPPFDQLMIEVHVGRLGSVKTLFKLFDRLNQLGLRVFSKERNSWGCRGVLCAEYSLISQRAAFRGHIYNQCPEYLPSLKQLCIEQGIAGCARFL